MTTNVTVFLIASVFCLFAGAVIGYQARMLLHLEQILRITALLNQGVSIHSTLNTQTQELLSKTSRQKKLYEFISSSFFAGFGIGLLSAAVFWITGY